MSDHEPRVALSSSALLGETPVWSVSEERLYWIDSIAATIHRFDPARERDEVLPVSLNGYLGAIALVSEGGLLILCGKELLRLPPGATKPEPIASVEAELPNNLPNDGKVDPEGRFWFGTMHAAVSEPTGGLYSYDRDNGLERHDGGFACANGMAWSPDGRTFYFVDTMPGHILAYDRTTGGIGGRRVFAAIDPAEGIPDGLCCDAEGGVWVALWDGWGVARYDAAGQRTAKIALPVPRPTCPAFGGPGLRTLFVTSSSDGQLEKAPLSGSLFAWQPAVPGLPVASFSG